MTRPIMQAMFSPGITYNAIKSGMAVDFPVLYGTMRKPNARTTFSSFALEPKVSGEMYHTFGALQDSEFGPNGLLDSSSWSQNTTFWDERLPFETVIDPDEHLVGKNLADLNIHPSGVLPYTASLAAGGNPMYKLMARNFYGETANFFLNQGDYTSLSSRVIPQEGIFVPSGTYWGARIKLRRSMSGTRDYSQVFNSLGYRFGTGSNPDTGGAPRFGGGWCEKQVRIYYLGGRRLIENSGGSDITFGAGQYQLPQDPVASRGAQQRESFTMYSRVTAFGPPISSIAPSITGDLNTKAQISASMSGAMDCFTGHNWSFTPPYYHGEAWCDLIFYSNENKKYTVDEILGRTEKYIGELTQDQVFRGATPLLPLPQRTLRIILITKEAIFLVEE